MLWTYHINRYNVVAVIKFMLINIHLIKFMTLKSNGTKLKQMILKSFSTQALRNVSISYCNSFNLKTSSFN